MSRLSFLRAFIAAALTAALAAALSLPSAASAADGERTPLDLDSASGAAANTATGGSGLLRTIVALVVVIGVIYAITWVLKTVKRAREEQGSGTALDAIASLPLGPNRSLHLVRAGALFVLLAVSEGGITPIRTYHEEEAVALGLVPAAEPEGDRLESLLASSTAVVVRPAAPAGIAARLLDQLRRRTVIR